jgi:hypothetical protein
MKTSYQLICTIRKAEVTDLDGASRLSGMHPEMIEVFLRAGIVRSEADGNGMPCIDPNGIERLCQIQRMRRQRRPVLRNIRLVFSLADQLAETRRQLLDLRNRLSGR